MTKRFKSTRRALKRGHLLLKFKEVLVRWENSALTGAVSPVFEKVPYLLRRTTRGRLVPYSG